MHVLGRGFVLVIVVLFPVPGLRAQASDAARKGAEFFARLREAEAFESQSKPARAAELYLELARDDPADAQLLLRAGQCQAAAGRRAEAVSCLERAYAAAAGVRYNLAHQLAQLCAMLDRTEEALGWLERALERRFVDRAGIADDPAFAKLKDNPRFRELAGLPPAGDVDRVQGWRRDLAFYASEVHRMHAGPSRPGESDAFAQALSRLGERVPELDDAQMFVELQRLTVQLGDGHSVVYPFASPRLAFERLPIRVYFFDDGLFVIGAPDPLRDLVGCQVLSIGGRPTAELLPLLETIVSRDNAMGVRWIGPFLLTNFTVLRALGLAAADHVDLVARTPAGAERPFRVYPAPPGGGDHGPEHLGPPPGTSSEAVAFWLRRSDQPFWFEELDDRGVVYAQINQIQDAPRQTLAQFAGEVRDALSDSGFETLVLDLRHNSGGNNFLVWPVVRLVAWFEEASPRHRTFVLTGRNTFSAAQNCLNQISRATHAIIAGEPSSSKPNFCGESTNVRLPWSGLRVSISSRWWQDSFPEDERPWIAPAIPVTLSSQDYFANRDPVLDAVFAVLSTD